MSKTVKKRENTENRKETIEGGRQIRKGKKKHKVGRDEESAVVIRGGQNKRNQGVSECGWIRRGQKGLRLVDPIGDCRQNYCCWWCDVCVIGVGDVSDVGGVGDVCVIGVGDVRVIGVGDVSDMSGVGDVSDVGGVGDVCVIGVGDVSDVGGVGDVCVKNERKI
ncbi:hypothetical protein Pmani_011076 [Petrolisthes manimaculis]|uniref:Uncharacterized protein n=1 Tax=Petrolisthes manimaculis TaxID=1843537 RepID=A0AAE1UBX1_9EUCA|nr:hypothetical protein Pmani_011076 [Petrolisthes manimaculis]